MLKDYEDSENYEECAIIKGALEDYKEKYSSKFPKDLNFPMHLSAYRAKGHQEMMKRLNITVEEKTAREKATLIKLNLPVEDGL